MMRALLAVLAVLAVTAPAAGAQTPQCVVLGTPCKLSVGLNDAQHMNPEPAPNGERVVFAHKTLSGPQQLYTVAMHGGYPVLLSPPGEYATFQAFTPDSGRVLYTSGTRLYSVPAAGPASARVRLADDVGAQPQIAISPDSHKVVFLPPSRDRLRVVPAAGPASAGGRLTDPFVPGGIAFKPQISADSRSVVYRADQETLGVTQLYRVPLTLSPAPDPPTARLNGLLAPDGDVSEFVLSPTDNLAVYRADQDTSNVRELYRVRLGGAENVKLNPPLKPGWEVRPPGELDDNNHATFAPDGSRIVFSATLNIPGWAFSELYSAPVNGPAVRLDSAPASGLHAAYRYRISPDSRRVVYALASHPATNRLISVPIAGPASAGLELTSRDDLDDFVFRISRDGRRVAYLFRDGVFSLPITDGTPVPLNRFETPSGFLEAGAPRYFVYSAEIGLTRALFSAPVDASGASRNLTASFGAGALALGPVLTADGRTVVYTMLRNPGANLELFSSRLAPAG